MHNTSGACGPRQKEISTKLLTKKSRTNDGERGVIVAMATGVVVPDDEGKGGGGSGFDGIDDSVPDTISDKISQSPNEPITLTK